MSMGFPGLGPLGPSLLPNGLGHLVRHLAPLASPAVACLQCWSIRLATLHRAHLLLATGGHAAICWGVGCWITLGFKWQGSISIP
jgi:hypothetical protein